MKPRLDEAGMTAVLMHHLARTPGMQLADLYKLLHQAAMGSGHSVRDHQAAQEMLEKELAALSAEPQDPPSDPLDPEGMLIRVHLRPYKLASRDTAALLQAFIRSANEWQASPDRLAAWCDLVIQLAGENRLPVNPKAAREYFAQMKAQAYPAVHHSETYRRLYQPAYRVVARQYMEAA
jgi:hypothetical protein